MKWFTTADTTEIMIGDTVTMDGHIGFFRRRVGDVRVMLLIQNARALDDRQKFPLLTFYDKLISCRAVLTEKTINFE